MKSTQSEGKIVLRNLTFMSIYCTIARNYYNKRAIENSQCVKHK